MASNKKKGCLGCSFPLLIGIAILVLALVIIGFFSGPIGKNIAAMFFPGFHLPEWLSPPQPEPELPAEIVFHLFGFPIANSVVAAWVTIIFLVTVSFLITRKLKLVPGRLQMLFEFLVGYLYNFCTRVAGEKHGRQFFPVVATIFLFVAFNAWLSLLPGYGTILIHTPEGEAHLLRGANTDINMPLAIAFASFIFVEYFGLKTLGLHYLTKFFNFGPLFKSLGLVVRGKVKEGFIGVITGFINAFVGILELISEFIRIVSFTFRLFGNMTAGEILLLVVTFLAPFVVGVVFYGLELLVGFVQALIFGGLTLIFLTLATTSHSAESTHKNE